MSSRSAGSKAMTTSSTSSVNEQQQQQSRGPVAVTRRAPDNNAGSTNGPRRSTVLRISAPSNTASSDSLELAEARRSGVDNFGQPPSYTASTSSSIQHHASTHTKRAPPSSYAPTGGLHGKSDEGASDDYQNVTAPRSFLQTRRRQPSTGSAKVPLGPRPVMLQPTNSARRPNGTSAAYNAPIPTPPFSAGSATFEPTLNDINDFNFAMIDPTRTVPHDRDEKEGLQFAFLQEPTFNFDDFQDTITTNDTSLNDFSLPADDNASQFSLPTGVGHANVPAVPQIDQRKLSQQTTIPAPTRKVSGTGTPLTRTASNASITGANRTYVSKFDPASTATPGVNNAARGRRQSHFPPNAFNNVNPPPKQPRKSIGPGTFAPPENGDEEAVVKRRPSVGGRKSSTGSSGSGSRPPRTHHGSREGSKSPRSVKTKSILVGSTSSTNLLTPSRTPDPQKIMSASSQGTPGKRAGTPGRTTTPGGNKRMSVATGLGARTISPTDARRMKRMSTMPTAPPVPNRRISEAPPTPQPDPQSARPASLAQSPAAQNRKSVTTPSSSRTTPDPNRKSYSSGQSLSSNTSYNSAKPPAPVPNRVQTSSNGNSTSRLPTPKPRSDGQEEEVPPVPAIPKSYDSPASEVDQPFFSARSSGLKETNDPQSDVPTAFDIAAAIANLKVPSPPGDEVSSLSRLSDQPAYPDSWLGSALPPLVDTASAPPSKDVKSSDRSKKASGNMRLPPINLLPISTPTNAKITSFHDVKSREPPSTPDGARGLRTPSTPMTASKATFFARHERHIKEPQNTIRSSTSHYALRGEDKSFDAGNARLPSFNFEADVSSLRSISPFISSSLPKSANGFGELMRPNFTHQNDLKRTATQQRPNGPRAPSYTVVSKTEGSTPITDQSGGSTPLNNVNSSSQNIQRKTSDTKLADLSGNDSDAARYDNMPPPRLPASATWSNLSSKSSASPTQKPGFFRSRRKTSASSTNTLDRQESTDSVMTQGNAARPSMESVRPSVMTHTNRSGSMLGSNTSIATKSSLRQNSVEDDVLDKDDLAAEEEMRKLASKRRDLEAAARKLDGLSARAKPVKRMSPSSALQSINLNIFERGEIVDYPDVYFCGTRSAKKIVGDLSSTSTNFGYDDDRGDYNIVEGDHLVYRYEVIDLLGKGSFGQVVRCIDHKLGQLVAIKIIRNKKRFHQQALVEVDILQKLKEWDPHKKHNVVNFDQSFYFRGHLCISTDLLDMNLYEFIKVHDFRGFSLKLIRRFTKQMLSSLVLLHHKRVIHCDLKPENILLAHPAHADIKVIDFGSSCFENEKVYTYIQSRFYRSPEVILGMSYGMPIDMWSLGCILAELYTGYPIFPGENEQEQLACIMEVFGPPEKHLIEKSTRKKLFFDSMGKPRLTVSSKGKRRRPSSKDLRGVLKCDDEAFLDFIARCLRWDPVRRLNPIDALRHEFITGIRSTTSTTRRNVLSSTYSPMKRNNTTVVPSSTIRPLPQPPAAGGLRPLTLSTVTTSPSKSAPRRQTSATQAGVTSAKRASHAAMNSGSSGTTRMTVKAVSHGRTDLAAAAAAASLVK